MDQMAAVWLIAGCSNPRTRHTHTDTQYAHTIFNTTMDGGRDINIANRLILLVLGGRIREFQIDDS
jgi:hypothetical protein